MRDPRWFMALLGCLLCSLSSLLWAEDTKKPATEAAGTAQTAKEAQADKEAEEVYLRVIRDDDGEPIELQTSIVHYVPADGKSGVTVDLVGAIHIADKSYYDELNKVFESYEVLLYELVAPEGTRIPKGGGGGSAHPISGMQRGMQSLLELDFQLDCIDYTKENFVHADMSPEEFSKSMKERNESMLQMFFKMMGHSAAMQANSKGASDAELLMAFFAKDRAFKLKRVMADQFENMDDQMAILGGEKGSTIITERNKKALAVLKRELEAGKKNVGIFYGAGHLADMHERLIKEFGLKKESERWVTAWKIEKTGKKAEAKKDEKKEEKKEELEPAESK